MTPQKKATLVSTSVAALLTIIKLFVGIASGSLAVLASAIDSILDMFVSIFNYFAITNSEKPADNSFNYGRGKIEALASLIEGVIITLSGVFLLYSAFNKYLNNETSSYLSESIIIMIISLIITIFLVIYLNKIAKETSSMVIKADALHYKTDVYTNVAVLVSLVLIKITTYEIIDIIIASAISLYIIYSAFELIQDGVLVLLDKSLQNEQVEEIKTIILKEKQITTYHLLKTREAANQIFVDVHLVFNMAITLYDAHVVSHAVEDAIKKINQNKSWVINIHLDPYDDFEINDNRN